MKYALVSDIHSSVEELVQVLQQIEVLEPNAKIVGLGDLFECTVSKKKLDGTMYPILTDVFLNPDGLEELLEFPSIRGNQEERIALVSNAVEPLLERIKNLPERLHIEDALLIHGHQWPYNERPPAHSIEGEHLVFHGHTHRSSWSMEGLERTFEFSKPIPLTNKQTIVNVGSVVDHKEWLLYDAGKQTVTFMKVSG